MKRITFLILGLFLGVTAKAQNGDSPITYQNLGLQFSNLNANGDPTSAGIPSVSSYNGYGSFMENPAVMAMTIGTDLSLGWFFGNNTLTGNYLGNETSNDYRNNNFGNIGLVYKIPTWQGSFVLGGGYSLNSTNSYNAFLSGRNQQSTITDMFKNPNNGFNDIAFEAFAIDYGDVEGTYDESIFRIGFLPGQFPGITQYIDIENDHRQGELSIFAATEFKKNLFLGVSLGAETGSSKYWQKFQEHDEFNDYDGDFIGADMNGNGGTDVDLITANEYVTSEIKGVNARIGAAYSVADVLTLGVGIGLPTKLKINETYGADIKTEFDDGTTTDLHEIEGTFKYSITRPAEYNFGATFTAIPGLELSGAMEIRNYDKIKISLVETDLDDPIEKSNLLENEKILMDNIKSDFRSVNNFRFGAKYITKNESQARVGYSIYPAQSKNFKVDKSVWSFGLSFPISMGIMFDITGQYSAWDDRSSLYNYEDPVSGELTFTQYDYNLDLFSVVAGFRVLF